MSSVRRQSLPRRTRESQGRSSTSRSTSPKPSRPREVSAHPVVCQIERRNAVHEHNSSPPYEEYSRPQSASAAQNSSVDVDITIKATNEIQRAPTSSGIPPAGNHLAPPPSLPPSQPTMTRSRAGASPHHRVYSTRASSSRACAAA